MRCACETRSLDQSRAGNDMLTPGTRLGRYEISALLGSGGMGQVYRARDTRLDREVAVKILPESFASDPGRRRRFEREARTAAAVSDPHAVVIFDAVLEGPTPYLVTELVEGGTLRTLLDSRRLTLRKALDLAGQIASGLASAHERGVVHRDVKPDNILVSSAGTAKIADFGLAGDAQLPDSNAVTISQTATCSTSEGTVLGTAGYMSPEQVRGEHADARSDIFSLGCVLFEMVTGQRAFQGRTSIDCLASILRDSPPSIRLLHPELPAGLDDVVTRCLEKSPDERFQSARDLGFALAAIPVEASPRITDRIYDRLSRRSAEAIGAVLGFLRIVLLAIP